MECISNQQILIEKLITIIRYINLHSLTFTFTLDFDSTADR